MQWYIAVPIAVVASALIIRVGFKMLSGLGQPIAPPPEPGDMRKINLRYRCDICGAELKMVLAGTVSGNPAPSTALRPMLKACSPT